MSITNSSHLEWLRIVPAVDAGGARQRFAGCLKGIRKSLGRKQIWLSDVVGCTDAAVSFWESGARLPTAQSFQRVLAVLATEGASDADLIQLRYVWAAEVAARRSGRRDYWPASGEVGVEPGV